MDFQVLVSTMNPDPRPFQDLGVPAVVISQNSSDTKETRGKVRFLSFNERGLSKSRNRAIEHADAEIALIADDDVTFCENFQEKISNGFKQYPEADILTFKILTPEGQPYKGYLTQTFKHNRSSIFKVSSVEMVVRPERLRKEGIRFDENFGLGATYPSGEEMIFLNDALNKGLSIYYVPEYIVCHPLESSGKILDENYFRSKGALIRRLYGDSIHLGLGFAFLIKQVLKPQRSISLFKAIKEILKGFNSIS
ncbi:glycosyltransferase [Algoriphagus halophytocola]|uniref:Glycosyltransferase n=1 Tax=Algoriphagus halophytocola TaxID=2991499 RepID=A0ABY6MIN3_9BACT|nr:MULTISPECIES: glycosyltransferase family 2 protein [unclassified Algoriphagus]UZD23038.1 glycosyltransferase [Algoriphagus sp. TR-M5]WBL44330.1 glycosyltransferase [Algoriphagus sp. TR-M9]